MFLPIIETTTDYKKFKSIEFNRNKSRRHIDDLKRMLEKENLLHLHPILVNHKMEVVDGQHRLAAAEEMELPIYFIRADISYDHILNSNLFQKKLNLEDVIKFYAVKDNIPDYREFLAMIIKLDLSCKSFLGLVFGTMSKPIIEFIRDGKFRMPEDRALIESLVCLYSEFMKFVVSRRLTPFVMFKSSKCVIGLRNLALLHGFEQDLFFKKLEQRWFDIRPQVSAKEWTKHLLDIYNYNNRVAALELPKDFD